MLIEIVFHLAVALASSIVAAVLLFSIHLLTRQSLAQRGTVAQKDQQIPESPQRLANGGRQIESKVPAGLVVQGAPHGAGRPRDNKGGKIPESLLCDPSGIAGALVLLEMVVNAKIEKDQQQNANPEGCVKQQHAVQPGIVTALAGYIVFGVGTID